MYKDVDKLVVGAECSTLHMSNMWVHVGPLQVYMRVGARYLNERMTPCIDIANVTCEDPGKGAFKAFLDYLESRYSGYAIFVENVFNERLCEHLQRRGYAKTDTSQGFPPCYFLPVRVVEIDYLLMEARVLAWAERQSG